MRVTKLTHACLRIEGAGVLVVDPGEFSEKSALDGADAVVITHEHFDHLDVAALTEAVRRRPELRIFSHAAVLAQLGEIAEATTEVRPGDEFRAAGFTLRAYGGQHAVIHPYIPRIANLGYLIDDGAGSLYHPGDSFVAPDGAPVDTLCVPLNAPWMKVSEAIEFARAVKPGRAIAIHDGLLNDRGAAISDGHLERFSETRYQHVAPGTTLT
ncbi:beta-lactamase [Actinoplanes sp. SE50]|uniref:MBL fold metallo-hydrolase n=1 Tax=unclassified Actinoplanes TaxID=2626549 RepID=UPI00023EDD7D|nr:MULTISPECIES: MBL fold metallo-hydrolase [unclassified Actinoplanes]AEV88615.1 beta-lactamase domain-containing protein [Actinoplanes sp. SE50/110]ATO87019.1 beta-lactamase [Actinoplanes sp. SE50]SLM04437.1 MBL fold metallo-hydrolase [Actinoplanes sp. SE50/110]